MDRQRLPRSSSLLQLNLIRAAGGETQLRPTEKSSVTLNVESNRAGTRLGAGYPVTNPPGRPRRRCGYAPFSLSPPPLLKIRPKLIIIFSKNLASAKSSQLLRILGLRLKFSTVFKMYSTPRPSLTKSSSLVLFIYLALSFNSAQTYCNKDSRKF